MHIEVIKWLVDDRPLLKSIFRFFATLLTVSYVQYSAHKSAGLSITYTNATTVLHLHTSERKLKLKLMPMLMLHRWLRTNTPKGSHYIWKWN